MGDLSRDPVCSDCGRQHPPLEYCDHYGYMPIDDDWAYHQRIADEIEQRRAPFGRNEHGVPNRPTGPVYIMVIGPAEQAAAWAEFIKSEAPVRSALAVPQVSWRQG